jgi:hypothetical protein
MIVYRTCAPRFATVDHFLDDLEEVQAIQSLISEKTMIDEIFSRGPTTNSSRFCPPLFMPNPLYVSENSMTTFYEYCFHLLNNQKFISNHRPMYATLYLLTITGQPKIKDISKNPPAGVMNKNNYAAAHKFIKNLKSVPHVIQYRSVRDKNKNINFAMFYKKHVSETGTDPKKITVSIISKKSVKIFTDGISYTITPKF